MMDGAAAGWGAKMEDDRVEILKGLGRPEQGTETNKIKCRWDKLKSCLWFKSELSKGGLRETQGGNSSCRTVLGLSRPPCLV